ncbi:MAG: hypothetical protein J6R26_00180 [Paludibacteraceae bacterium]|nr:hypothetical protein [Paludibacteraceae bacterium]
MKKLLLLSAVFFAVLFTSCGDTNHCYLIIENYKIPFLGTAVTNETYVWSSSNEMDILIERYRANADSLGISEDYYSITYQRADKSYEDCL